MNGDWQCYTSWLNILEHTEWRALMKPFFAISAIEEGGAATKDDLYNTLVNSQGAMEAQKKMQEDTRWADSMFVLVEYKTEPCKRQARLCRQGYACPSYHNTKDRRRSPKTYKYRSTPCPLVKSHDEWGDPTSCDSLDNCQYCHTRTEQQFHPEIYKSTRCKDMQQYQFCPRGPFCAFAHDDEEAQLVYDISNVEYPSTTSPPTSNPALDRRGRSYTHSGLPFDTSRSGSANGRVRSLSLIETMANMALSANNNSNSSNNNIPRVSTSSGSHPMLADRNRSQSQGSETSNLMNASAGSASTVNDIRESSPRVPALSEAVAHAVQQQQQQQQKHNFYNNKQPLADLGANGHYARSMPPNELNFNAEQSADLVMFNGLINNKCSNPNINQHVIDSARLLQQQQHLEQQRIIAESIDAIKAISKYYQSLCINYQKLPLNILEHLKQQSMNNLDDVNTVIAYRKQMLCIVCNQRNRDGLTHPCSHFVACQECLKSHSCCPACKEVIRNIYRVTV